MPDGWRLRLKALGRPLLGPCVVQAAGTAVAACVDNTGITSASVRVVTTALAATSATVPATWTSGDWVDIDIVIPVEAT